VLLGIGSQLYPTAPASDMKYRNGSVAIGNALFGPSVFAPHAFANKRSVNCELSLIELLFITDSDYT